MEWFFDGLGTELISALIGLLLGGLGGGAVGWKLALHQFRQSQRAGDHSTQTQIGGMQFPRDDTKDEK